MPTQKRFGERILDLAFQYGGIPELAKSLNMPQSTLRGWIKRDNKPNGLRSYLEEKTGNPRAIERRERYREKEVYDNAVKKATDVDDLIEGSTGILTDVALLFAGADIVTDGFSALTSEKINNSDSLRVHLNARMVSEQGFTETDYSVKTTGRTFNNVEAYKAFAWKQVRGFGFANVSSDSLEIIITGIKKI